MFRISPLRQSLHRYQGLHSRKLFLVSNAKPASCVSFSTTPSSSPEYHSCTRRSPNVSRHSTPQGRYRLLHPKYYKQGQILRHITSVAQDIEHEKKLQKKKLETHPSEVTSTSSVRPIVEQAPDPPPDSVTQKEAFKGGIQHDLDIIKETFAFREVPKEVILLGGSGLIPYVVTTASTLFLAWDIKNIQEYGTGYLVGDQTALQILEFLEPVQVGFGAIILSFLGAIHWGLEFAAFGGSSPYRRYVLGILAPALAWPTVFMPYDIALLTQFLGFTGMYFADAKMTSLGWAPRWYTTYRFLLTFVVGACIVITLIGRGKVVYTYFG